MSVEQLAVDAHAARGGKPFVLASLAHRKGIDEIVALIEELGGLAAGRRWPMPADHAAGT